MKLAVILPSLRNVGPVRVAFDIICGLIKSSDFEITVFYLQDKVEMDFPCETVKLCFRNIFRLYSYDIIHSHMIKPDFISAILLFYRGEKISTIHNIVESDLFYSHGLFISKVVTKIWLLIWKRLDKCVVLSNVAKNYYEKLGLKKSKIHRIYNGVQGNDCEHVLDKDIEERIKKIKEKYTVLGTICLFNHRKGLEQVVKALEYMDDYAFVIIGDGPVKDELYNLACELGVDNRVIFLGFIHEAGSYLSCFDIYMMPSREEGFALSLLDAVVAEVPVVCSDIPVFKEAFIGDEVSFFKLDDIEDMVEAIVRLKEEGKYFSMRAKERFLACYTQDIMVESYKEIYLDGG